jgi:hypothetical protein
MKPFKYINITTLYFIKDSYAHSSKPQMKRTTAAPAAAAVMRTKSFRNETMVMQQDGCSENLRQLPVQRTKGERK